VSTSLGIGHSFAKMTTKMTIKTSNKRKKSEVSEDLVSESTEKDFKKDSKKVSNEAIDTFVKPTREELWQSKDIELWKEVLRNYEDILSKSKKAGLKESDDWYYNELPKVRVRVRLSFKALLLNLT
jgi:hypothetical protein